MKLWFPKMMGTFLWVPIIRIVVFGCLYIGISWWEIIKWSWASVEMRCSRKLYGSFTSLRHSGPLNSGLYREWYQNSLDLGIEIILNYLGQWMISATSFSSLLLALRC